MSILDKQYEWPLIARDLALLATPVSGATNFTPEAIAASYGMSDGEFRQLAQLPAFLAIVEQEVGKIQRMGANAGVRMRAEAMAMAMQEKLFARAQDGDLDDRLSVELLRMLMRSAGIEQPEEAARAAAPQSTVNIAFNVPRLPSNGKLAHLAAQPQTRLIEGGTA